jgi:hypothetical protein
MRASRESMLRGSSAASIMEIAVTVTVPTMIVFTPAMISIPIADVVLRAVVARLYPAGAGIGRTRPVAVVPLVVMADWVPIAWNPNELRARWRGQRAHARWWWRPDVNPHADRYLGATLESGEQEEHRDEHQRSVRKATHILLSEKSVLRLGKLQANARFLSRCFDCAIDIEPRGLGSTKMS